MHFKKCMTDAAAETPPTAINELVNQIAFADVVLLNKIDLVSPSDVNSVEAQVRSINSVARVIHTRLDSDDSPQWLARVCASAALSLAHFLLSLMKTFICFDLWLSLRGAFGKWPACPSRPPHSLQVLGNGGFCLKRALQVDPAFLDASSSDDGATAGKRAASSAGLPAAESSASPKTARSVASSVANKDTECTGTSAPSAEGSGGSPRGARLQNNADKDGGRRPAKAMHDLGNMRSIRVVAPGLLDDYRFNMFMRDFMMVRCRAR